MAANPWGVREKLAPATAYAAQETYGEETTEVTSAAKAGKERPLPRGKESNYSVWYGAVKTRAEVGGF